MLRTPLAPDRFTAAGAAAAAAWAVFCVAWFDAGAAWRPAALAAVPRLVWLLPVAAAAALWLRGRWPTLRGEPLGAGEGRALVSLLALAFFFRLPVVLGGAGVAVTSDGALSGIVALHARDGLERLVFVPQVPYSGSLKSHLTAPLALVLDPAVSFALVSVLFYLAYVAGLYRLARLVAPPRTAVLAGLYAAFSPAFVTRYSLSNDGNYVEVLALSAWALWLAGRWAGEPAARPRLAFAAGLLLGLGFWCHILAIIPLAALALFFVLVGRLGAVRSLGALAAGWAVGYAPGWLWNAANDWESFHYLVPGQARTDAAETGLAAVTAGLGEKLWLMVTDHWPVLMGYDTGYGPLVDALLRAIAWVGVAAALGAAGWTAWRAWRERSWPLFLMLLFAATNVAVALVALAHVPGNPRYILFLMCVVPVMLADALGSLRAMGAGRPPSPRRDRRPRLARAGAGHAPGRRAVAAVRLRHGEGGRALLLHRLLPRHARELPLGREDRVHGQAGADHHRVLLLVPRAGGEGPRGGVHRREPHVGGPPRRAAERAGCPLRPPGAHEAGADAALAQGRPRGAVPGPRVSDEIGGRQPLA